MSDDFTELVEQARELTSAPHLDTPVAAWNQARALLAGLADAVELANARAERDHWRLVSAQAELDEARARVAALEAEARFLADIARSAGDVSDQIHPDVNWDRVPPWTMDAVQRLNDYLERFDAGEDDRRALLDSGERP